MKTKTSLKTITLLASAAVILVSGCKKNGNTLSLHEEEQATVYATQSETDAQFAFDDIADNVMGINSELGIGGVGIFGRTMSDAVAKMDSVPSCVSLSITPLQPNVFPKTVVIDFGAGCTSYGHLRAGKIITVFSGRLIEPGQSATTTFENYTLDAIKVEGTHKISNSTAAGSNQRQFRIEIRDGKISNANGDYQEWNATRTHTQLEGNGTLTPTDDIFRITGSSKGQTKSGSFLTSWSATIPEPLIKHYSCRWLSKGTIETTRNRLPSGSSRVSKLDLGDGTCDNKAVLTINGQAHQIVLR